MADSEADIRINIDTTSAMASIKNLQRQISAFHTQMQASGNAANAALSKNMQKTLVDSINATGKFSANLTTIKSTTESFTNALEKNKLSMGEYFRYAGASTKTFGRLFKSEFSTIDKVARERVKTLQTQYIKMGRDASGALQAIKVRPIALDMENLGTQTAMAAQKQALFNQLIKQGSTNLLNWGKNTQWAGRQLMVGFTIPLSIFGSVAVKEFKKIEEQAVKFRRVYGDMFNTDAETEKALNNVKSLAQEFTKYGIAIEKTIDLAAKVAQMGNTGKALDQQVIQATRLSVLGGMEQMDALDTTISLTNAFGVSIDDLSSKINFLNAAENQTILAIEDFNTAIPLAGSVVKQLGGEVEDLAVLLTAMREGGINASQAGNALKSSLARLIAPSRNAKETLSEFGINIMGIVENNAGNLMNTINSVAFALDELDPLSRARAIEALFGKFQFARMSTLFSNITREGSQANKVLDLTRNSAAELAILAERELKRVEDSPAFKLDKQMEKLKASMAPIGEEFVKLITPIVEFATKLLEQFNNMGDGGKQFVTGLVAVLGLIAPAALMVVGLVANGVANLLKGFNALRLLYQRLGGSSTELASQTQFLTTEQLEAAAVAASLEQSHARLTQSFTSETAAIYKLIAAYQAATRAQLAMNAAAASQRIAIAPPITRVPGFRRAQSPGGTIAGYNKGIFSVPGPKGAGDIVPAMLSPGEAVIPAKQSEKYRGLISSLISDNVPGYNKGTLSAGSSKKAVVAFGAHQPFTSAHQDIAKLGMGRAKDAGAEFLQFTTMQGKAKRSILDDKLKAKLISEAIGVRPNFAKNPFDLMKNLSERGYKNIELLLGEDRMSSAVWEKAAKEYGIDLKKTGIPRPKGSVSGTETRAAAASGNKAAFANFIARGISPKTLNLVYGKLHKQGIIPGHRFGFNPFANMLSRSRVAVRMKDQDLISALRQGGKNARYKSAFETQTGADYIKQGGRKTTRQRDLRSAMERDVFGLDPKTTSLSARPTYGYARTSILQSIINRAFGIKGKNFNASTRNLGNTLDKYGNVDLVTKNSVARRSSAFPGDALVNYNRASQSNTARRLPNLNIPVKNTGIQPSPMRGASAEQLGSFERLGSPFGKYQNPKPAYIETYTPGGFSLKEVDKIIARDPAIVKQLRAELKQAGLGSTRVEGAGFAARLFKKMGVPGYKSGVLSAGQKPASSGADSYSFNKADRDLFRKLSLDAKAQQRYKDYMDFRYPSNKRYRIVPASLLEFGGNSSLGREALARLAQAKVAKQEAVSIMSKLADAPSHKEALNSLKSAIANNTNEKGRVNSSRLKTQIKGSLGIKAHKILKEFAHVGSGAKITAAQAIDLYNKGQLELSPGKIAKIREARPSAIIDIKSGLGFDLKNTRIDPVTKKIIRANVELDKKGSPLKGFLTDYQKSGVEKWNRSIGFGGGDPKKLASQTKLFDSKIVEILSRYPKDTLVVDSETQARRLIAQNKNAVSFEKVFDDALKQTSGATRELQKTLRAASSVPTEIRSSQIKGFGSPGKIRKIIGKPLDVLSSQIGQTTKASFAKIFGSGKPGSIPQLASLFSRFKGFPTSAKIGGYAKGVVSVPGPKGAGDVVPAMLSPGEAVIPAKMSQKYAPLISSMISGKVPGYQEGRDPAGRGNSLGKIGGAASIAGMGAMAYGMTGGPGSEMAMMASMPLMMLPMIVQMLGAKISLVVAGLGLAVGSIAILKTRFDESAKAARENALAMGASTKAVQTLAEFSGKVTAGEIMNKRREESLSQFSVQGGKESFGNLFVQSEVAAPMLETLKKGLEKGKAGKELVKAVSNQLSTAVVTGVLTRDQAASIAAALGEQIQDRAFGINVIGQIDSLVSIDGTNLLKDPIGVRVKLMEETKNTLKDQISSLGGEISSSSQAGKFGIMGGLGIAGGIAGGFAGLAAATAITAKLTAMGATVGSVAPGIGTAIGAVVGAGAGLAAGAAILYQSFEQAGAAAGAIAAQGIIALQQNQEMLDSLDLEYEKRIANAKAAGDLLEAERLISEQQQGRQKLLDIQKQTMEMLVQQYRDSDFFGINPLGEQIDQLIDSMYKDNPLMQMAMTGARKSIEGSAGTAEQEFQLKLTLASGNIDAGTVSNLMAAFGQDKEAITKIVDITTKLSSADSGRTFAIASLFGDDKEQKKKFLFDMASKEEPEARKLLEMFEIVQQSGGALDINVILNAYMKNPKAGLRLAENLDKFKEAQERGPIQLSVIQSIFGAEIAAAVLADWEYFNSLDKETQIVYFTHMVTTFQTIEEDKDALDLYREVTGNKAATKQDYAIAETYKVTQSSIRNRPILPDVDDEGPGGGGKPETPWYEEILKKLKNLRDAVINTKGGIEELRRVIRNTQLMFEGLGQKFVRAGILDSFADELMDMEEDVRRQFVQIGQNGTAILTELGRLRNEAYSRADLGAFQVDQLRVIRTTSEQTAAVNKLTAAGLTLAQAYEVVADRATAAAIATDQLSQTALTALIADIRAAASALQEFQNVSSVRISAEETNNLVKAANQLKESSYSFAEQQAILSNSSLTELFLSQRNQDLLRARIKQILTPEFLQGIFDEGFNAAMDAFAVQERTIELDFQAKMKVDFDIIEAAQNQIAGIEYIIDDLQAGIREIENQEEAVNEAYDKRIKALEEVKTLNEDLTRQQKGQLSVAEALSKGDISAAARAIQELRTSRSQIAINNERKALDLSREKDLARLVSANGKTRKELETEIKNLQNEIFMIEESRLEPAQERVRLAEIEKNELIDAVTVLDQTREQWERIQNGIDIARISSERYNQSIKDAIAQVENLKKAWREATPGGVQVDIPAAQSIASPVVASTAVAPPSSPASPTPGTSTGPDPTLGSNTYPPIGRKGSYNGERVAHQGFWYMWMYGAWYKQGAVAAPAPLGSQSNPYTTGVMPGMSIPGTQSITVPLGKYVRMPKDLYMHGVSIGDNALILRYGNQPNASRQKIQGNVVKAELGFDGAPTPLSRFAVGGQVGYYPMGGAIPYKAMGGIFKTINTDSVPAMLTPGEFVIRRSAVERFGEGNLAKINKGLADPMSSVYNYSVNVSVKSDANPNEIARAVMTQIKQIDSQRIRGNRF